MDTKSGVRFKAGRAVVRPPQEAMRLYGWTLENPGVAGVEFTHEVWGEMLNDEKMPLNIWLRYKQESERFLDPAVVSTPQDRAEMVTLGLFGELGEMCDHIKKHRFQGHEFDPLYVLKELGDIIWYLARSKAALPAQAFAGKVALNLSVSNLRATMLAAATLDLPQVLFNVLGFGAHHNFTLTDILGANLVKLHHRYPTGGFRVEDSVERKAVG